jgi:hypothetical protein
MRVDSRQFTVNSEEREEVEEWRGGKVRAEQEED